MPTVIRVVGWSNSGKTTLIERLIPLLRDDGVRVATIKHAHHPITPSHQGKDSGRHLEAGASSVEVVSGRRGADGTLPDASAELDRAIARVGSNIDLVLVEGFKHAVGPKISVELNSQWRVEILEHVCRVSADPRELSADELRRLVSFCIRHVHHGATRALASTGGEHEK